MGSSSSANPQTPDPTPQSASPAANSPEIKESAPPNVEAPKGGEDPIEGVEEEEEAECGFCLFMKAGGCRDEFVAWEKCVQDAEKDGGDIAEKCFEVTSMLKKCMDAHADYYEPILSAEKAMADSASEEALEEEAKKISEAVEEEVKKEPESEESKVEVITVTESG